VTIGDPHILAVIRVDAVAIGHTHIIENADTVDQHIPAADHMDSPECALFQCYLGDGQMLHVFQE
jgi:hypothetical protein